MIRCETVSEMGVNRASVCPLLQMVWECDKDNIDPALAGAQRKIVCATFGVTDFEDDKKSLIFKRENNFRNCLRTNYGMLPLQILHCRPRVSMLPVPLLVRSLSRLRRVTTTLM